MGHASHLYQGSVIATHGIESRFRAPPPANPARLPRPIERGRVAFNGPWYYPTRDTVQTIEATSDDLIEVLPRNDVDDILYMGVERDRHAFQMAALAEAGES
jgi:hypothetical protein